MNTDMISITHTELNTSPDIRIDIHSSGFTLFEISIVLIIIGLLAGGILVGRDMINAAQLRSEIGQLEKFSAAAHTFRLKYNGIPGDKPDTSTYFPTDFLGGPGTNLDGVGNGMLYQYGGGNTNFFTAGYIYSCPALRFFPTLATANLIALDYNKGEGANIVGNCGDTYFPVSKVRGRIYAFTNAQVVNSIFNPSFTVAPDGQNYYVLGATLNFSDCNSVGARGVWTSLEALTLDRKIDDGAPMTGTVRIISSDQGWNNLQYDPIAGVTPCVTAGAAYDRTNPAQACALRVKAGF